MKRFLLLALLPLATTAHAASFDCARAASPDERVVCADPRLSALDTTLGEAYAQARKTSEADDQPKLTIVARGILADRRACGTATGCLLAVYIGGLESYQRFGSTIAVPDGISALDIAQGRAPQSARLPSRPGDCVTTRITEIGARLEGDNNFESGTTVEFANGGHQVSYEREAAIVASRRGDPAVMCLTVIPRACPPGDDRGRFYTVTNPRTHTTWSLPDSQHLCGGA